MASERLQVILQLVAGQYKREAKQAASATGQMTGQMGQAGTATSKLDKQIGNTGITMRHAVTAGAAVAGAAVASFAKDSVRAASDLQESMNAVEKVFGPVADEIHALGEESADSFGMSQSAFNDFAVRFSAFADTIADESGQKVVDVVDEMSGRVADFASVHNLSLEEAARVAQSTLAGETEVFRRFGGDVSAAAVEAKLLEEGIVETGEAISEQDKILGRYMLFMEQTEDAAGDFKDTQDDLANASRTFAAEMEDAQAEIGEALLPVLAELVNVGRDLIPMFKNVATELVVVTEQAAPLIDALMFVNSLLGDSGDEAEDAAESQSILGAAFQGVMDFANPLGAIYREIKEATEDNTEAASELTDAELAARDAFADLEPAAEGAAEGMYDARDAALLARPDIGDLAGAVRDQGGAWDDVVTSMEDYETMIRRLTDPVFAAIDDQQNLEDATQRYLDIIDDPDATVGEQERAMWDLVEAQRNAEESAAELPDDLQAAADHISILGDRAGITDEHLQILRDTIMSFDGLSAQSTIGINVVGGERIEGLDINRNVTLRQHGGPVRAGEPYVVGEAGPELFIPQQSGQVIANQSIPQNMTSQSGFDRTVEEHHHYHLEGTGEPETDAQRVGSLASVVRRMETL